MTAERIIALVDGEHYPPVVRFALDALRDAGADVVAAVFLGGTEKIDALGPDAYGVPLITGSSAGESLTRALAEYAADAVVDLSDEPVLSAAERMSLACRALEAGVTYRGADFEFRAPRDLVRIATPTISIIGTGKRVGKTSVSAHAARCLTGLGTDVAVLAMGRGGPAEPELIRGELVRLTTDDLLELARQGKHASSDNYEDAVMSRVTTVGCRRCGGGLAGETFFSNVPEGALLADTLGKDLVILEGSGAAIPPVHANATMLVVGAGRGVGYVRDFMGPYRLARADLVVIAGAEEPIAGPFEVAEVREAIVCLRPDVPVFEVTFRPAPLEDIRDKRVFFATTAPVAILPRLVAHLEKEHGCEVVASSSALSDRARLRSDIEAARGTFDTLVTELKAAAIDVVAEAGRLAGVPTVLCDNVPVPVDGSDFSAEIGRLAHLAIARNSEAHEGGGGA